MIPIEWASLGMVLTFVAGLLVGVGMFVGGGSRDSSGPPPVRRKG